MAHDPKLEIYKLILKSKSDGSSKKFREVFRTNVKEILNLKPPIEEHHIFRAYHQNFLTALDLDKFKIDSKKDKAIKIAKSNDANGNLKSEISSPTTDNFIITGLIEGGKYNIKRTLGDIDNSKTSSTINPRNVVCDKFFFLLYTPINKNIGILMIQGYTEIKISDIFREHIGEYFSVNKEIECQTEYFIPENLKEKYLQGASFNSAKFTSGFIFKNDFEGSEDKPYDIEVKIEILDKSKQRTDYTLFQKMLTAFGNMQFNLSNEVKRKLENFANKSAKMKGKSGKEFPIDFDNINNIKPTILLEQEGIRILDGRVPDFKQIENYCQKLLKDIINEIDSNNAIKNI